jgi:membrane fusion protein (multidrug efflux system)
MTTIHARFAHLFALLLLAVFLVSGCDKTDTAKAKKSAKHYVEVVKVTRQPIATKRIVTGTLESLHSVRIFNEEEGKISKLPFYPGDRVEEGQELVQLDDTIIQAELDKAQASYQQAKLDLKRLKQLMPRKLASEDQVARAETALQQARAEQNLLKTRIERTRMYAPFTGLISERHKEPGDVVPVHSHVLTLIDPAELIARLYISEILLANIKPGMSVQLRIDALGDTQYTAKVTRVYPTINPATRQGVFEIKLDPIPEGAVPGQLCRVTVDAQTQPLRAVPLNAVRHDANGEFVYGVKDGKAYRTKVTTGIQIGNYLEITEGLQDNDVIVRKGFLGLRNKKDVTINESKPANKTAKGN